MPQIVYPALLWRKGYIYLASTPLELCAHPRALFNETVQRTHDGEYHLIDADGRFFNVIDWVAISPFGGLRGIGLRLLRSVFAAPVLANESRLSLPDFKKKLAGAVRSRYRYDTGDGLASDIIRKLQAAESHRTAIEAIPRL